MTTTPLDQLTTNRGPSMRHVRFSIARLLGLILLFGIVLAGLRSGSNDWFKLIYSLTFLSLVYAAIAARYRGAFWYGFAVAGWMYFVVGFGPWISSPAGSPPPGTVNRNLVSSVVLEIVPDTMSRRDSPAWSTGPGRNLTGIIWANRGGIAHCALTILFAYAGGLVAKSLARRSATDSANEDRNRSD